MKKTILKFKLIGVSRDEEIYLLFHEQKRYNLLCNTHKKSYFPIYYWTHIIHYVIID